MGESIGKIRDTDKLLEGIPNLGLFIGDFGEHNENILKEIGLSSEEVMKLKEEEII